MKPIARKSTVAFMIYGISFLISTMIIVVGHLTVETYDLEVILLTVLIYLFAIIFLYFFVRMLFLPKVLIWDKEDTYIISRGFKKIEIKKDSIVSVNQHHAFTRLGRHDSRNLEHKFGDLEFKTKHNKYVVFGVANVDTVKAMISTTNQESHSSKSIFKDEES